MRTTKQERKENAKLFYQMLMNGYTGKAAVVVKRADSVNPNISRCQFLAVPPSNLAYMESAMVIAESNLGIEGCFIEFLGSIKKCTQKTYWEDGFNEWLEKEYGFRITYKDGLVFMFER